MNHPQYRLRVGEIRVFYDIKGNRVEILAIVPKTEAVSWLKEIGG
jgi:mRNA-degrading endonuclease RelE of RelBE toxin-antitoxin system